MSNKQTKNKHTRWFSISYNAETTDPQVRRFGFWIIELKDILYKLIKTSQRGSEADLFCPTRAAFISWVPLKWPFLLSLSSYHLLFQLSVKAAPTLTFFFLLWHCMEGVGVSLILILSTQAQKPHTPAVQTVCKNHPIKRKLKVGGAKAACFQQRMN